MCEPSYFTDATITNLINKNANIEKSDQNYQDWIKRFLYYRERPNQGNTMKEIPIF